MDTRTGEIGPMPEMLEKVPEEYLQEVVDDAKVEVAETGTSVRPITMSSLPQRVQDEIRATGRSFMTRNSTCYCGSGKRFKRCCMGKAVRT